MSFVCTNFANGMIDTSAFQGKKAAYSTLGCKLNFSETSTFGRMLRELGVTTADKGETADICIINTCSVTDVADHKCRQAIRRTARDNPGALVVVTGCYAQLEPQTVSAIEGVDLVLGNNEKARLIQYLSEAWVAKTARGGTGEGGEALHRHRTVPVKDIKTFTPACSRGNRTRYFLKVQDGCSYFCSYCTIPFARGPSRSPDIASIVRQAEQVAEEGGKEIVLTGVNIGDFGRGSSRRFIDLVKALDQVEGISRYRISSIEPDLLDDSLIEYCAGSRAFMPHFHIPLQSGSNAVLRLMRRRYDTELFASKVALIKHLMPNAFIGVDVMVGTRGETDEFFSQSQAFIENLDISQLHVFPYSERPGTAALNIPGIVTPKEKKRRCKLLMDISEQKTRDFYNRYVGTERRVLVEKAIRGRVLHGFTDNYIRVEIPAGTASAGLDNKIVSVRLGRFNASGNALTCENIKI